MKTKEFEGIAHSFFPESILNMFNDGTQFGFNNYIEKDLLKIGYSVNLTMDIIEQAKREHIDLIMTHHNIWEDHFELRDDCLQLLKKYNIIHYFNHLPLDSMDFGPSRMLAKQLGVTLKEDFCKMNDVSFGVVGEFNSPISLEELKARLEKIFKHEVRIWKNNEGLIKRVGIVSGSGADLESLHDALNHGCDSYITGEKKLKSLLYARHVKLNFILGSHTFSELGGIESFANLIKTKADITFIQLNDEFIE